MKKQTRELNQLNNELDKRVNEENNEILTDMVCYLRGANISEYHQETVRQDLLEMVLSAQDRGESLEAVIGEDYKAFCDEVIASLPPKSKREKMLDFIDAICWSLSILFGVYIIISPITMALIKDIVAGRPVNPELSVSAGSIVSCFVITAAACFIVEFIMKNSFKIGKKPLNRIKLFLLGAGIMVIFLLIAWIGRATAFTVNIFVACAITLILYIIHNILSKIQ